MAATKKLINLSTVLTTIASRDYELLQLKVRGKAAFVPHVHKGDDRLVIFFGPNASGKSLMCTIAEMDLRKGGVAVRSACMRNRTTSGIERALVLGSEHDRSTGATSYSFVKRCLESTFSPEAQKAPAIAILDEPDVGLSDDFAAAMGDYIAGFANKMHQDTFAHVQGVLVVCHNRTLLEGLLHNYQGTPTAIGMNEPRPLAQWIKEGPTPRKPADLEDLLEVEHARKRLIWSLTSERQAMRP